MGGGYSGCEGVSLRRTANTIIGYHRGFRCSSSIGSIEVMRAYTDGQDGTHEKNQRPSHATPIEHFEFDSLVDSNKLHGMGRRVGRILCVQSARR
jgi:hypothetical protein